MALTIADRKFQMPFGAQRRVAEDLGVPESFVSEVMSGDVRPKTEATWEKVRRTQDALAAQLDRPWQDVFSEEERGPVASSPL